MTYLAVYPPTAFVTDMFRRTTVKPVIIEFHNTVPSLGTRLWQLVPIEFHFDTKRNEKAWTNTIDQIKELKILLQTKVCLYQYYLTLVQFNSL